MTPRSKYLALLPREERRRWKEHCTTADLERGAGFLDVARCPVCGTVGEADGRCQEPGCTGWLPDEEGIYAPGAVAARARLLAARRVDADRRRHRVEALVCLALIVVYVAVVWFTH